MSDLQLLYAVLAVLYLWECACWVRRGSIVIRTWLGRNWEVINPGSVLGNQRGGFVFAPPMPPLGNVLIGTQVAVSLSSRAVLAHVGTWVGQGGRPPQSARLLLYEEIRTLEARGKKVLLNGELFLKFGSPAAAERLVETLNQIRQLAAAKRGNAVERMFADSLNVQDVQERWEVFEIYNRKLRPLTNGLFVFLFGVAPLAIWQFGLSRTWLALLVTLLGTTLAIMVRFRQAHRRLYPTAEEDRFSQSMMVLLYPALAIRAADLLSRPLLEAFHPLALAQVFCPVPAFREFAARVLRELKYPALPVCPRRELAAQEAERFSREALLRAVENLLKKSGLKPEELVAAPARADATCTSYCPRCLAQFTASASSCPDCGGVAVVPLCAQTSLSGVKNGSPGPPRASA